MKQDKTKIRLQLLYDQVKRYQKMAIFGVRADDPEVINLWVEYNEIRGILSQLNPELFADLKVTSPPEPDEASSFGRHDVGELVFKPMHFIALERQVEKAIEYMTLLNQTTPIGRKEKQTDNINIKASQGSMVNVTIGDHNKIFQNAGQIAKVLEELEGLGVDKDEIATLKEIIADYDGKTEHKEGVGKKLFGWISGLAARLVEKGITDNLPVIIEKAKTLIDYL
jgi:hypothetical protein